MAGNFVGRQALLARVLKVDIGSNRQGRFVIVPGIPGSGKTEFLNQIRRAVEEEGVAQGTVIYIRGADYEAPGSRRAMQAFDEAAEFRQFQTLLQERLPNMVDGAVTDALNLAETRPALGGRRHAPSVTGNDPGQLIDRATETVTLLARDLAVQDKQVLVLVDDFHLLASRPLGDWLLRWLVNIRGADIVVSLLPGPAEEISPWPSHAITLPLGNLSRDDVQRYLAYRGQVGPDVAADIIGPVWEFTGGHPQALVLAADLIRESEQAGDAVQAIRQVAAQEGELADKLEELVERIFGATEDLELRHALYSLCVARHFDMSLLMLLLGVDKARAEFLIDQMRQFSFVTAGVTTGFLEISPFVRRIGQTKHTDGSRRGEIHTAAAQYFHGLICKEVDEDRNWAQAWRRLEDRRFQTLKKEWLYHVSRLTGRQRRTGRLEIAELFLDGFWWWGCYVPFPFCEEILADWMSATTDEQASKEDREWGQALRAVYDTYPRGNRLERATRPQLITVRRYLRQLWDRGGLDDLEGGVEASHVRGIINVFLADILRYLNPADHRVDEALDDAEALLGEEDQYFVAWIDFQRGDLEVQRGQWEEAMSRARRAAERHAQYGDHELTANFHRIHADALWALGEAGPALDGYARAVLHAYAAQVLPQASPDIYTNAFQQEMTDRCMDRMAALHAAADDSDGALTVLHSASARIRAFFAEYWDALEGGETTDIATEVVQALDNHVLGEAASVLFPALAPDVDTDLTRVGTEWELICHDVLGEMKDELNALPGTPLPGTPLPPATY